MKSTRWVITYIVVASLGLWGALFMSLKFMTPGRAQDPQVQPGSSPGPGPKAEPPSPGDLPPEFLQETQNPPPGGNGSIPPPPTQTPTANEALPPPPVPPTGEAESSQVQAPPNASPAMGPADEPMPVDEVPVVEQTAIPVTPKFASDDQYNYDPTGRRDPFKPYRAYKLVPSNNLGAKPTDETDPLQRWDLERFAVVAILWEVRHPRAMVQDPDGRLYMIGKKSKIGRNSGQVVAIREGEVVVVESVDNEGVQTKEVKILELKK